MSRSEAKELRERVTELERRLAAAEARIAMLETRPVAILPPVFVPQPAPCVPCNPYPIYWQGEAKGGALPLTLTTMVWAPS